MTYRVTMVSLSPQGLAKEVLSKCHGNERTGKSRAEQILGQPLPGQESMPSLFTVVFLDVVVSLITGPGGADHSIRVPLWKPELGQAQLAPCHISPIIAINFLSAAAPAVDQPDPLRPQQLILEEP